MKRGKVIAFEGVDGAGKSTVLALVAEHLRSQGVSVFLPREGKDHKSRPTRMIRDLTRDRKNLELCARSELLMYAAREAQVLEQDVRPAIARGQTVLLDRSMWTPVVLGSAGRGLDFDDCHALAKSASHGLQPDTMLVFDVHPRTSRIRKRLAKASVERVRDGSRKGLAGSELKVRVRDGYRDLAERFGFPLLCAERATPQQMTQRVISLLEHGSFEQNALDQRPLWDVEPEQSFEGALSQLPPSLQLYFSRRLEVGRVGRAALYEEMQRAVVWAADPTDPILDRIRGREDTLALARLAAVPLSPDGPRRRLANRYPVAVARSLKGLVDDQADALRTALATEAPGAVLESLAGRDDAFARTLRERCWPHAGAHERAGALVGLADKAAWRLRQQVLAEDPAVAVANMFGLHGAQCDEVLETFAPHAPKAVLRALQGRSDALAHRMRGELIETGREVIDSIRGLADPQSFALREACLGRWPSSVAWSLLGLGDNPETAPMLQRCRAAAPGDLFLKRRLHILANVQFSGVPTHATGDDFDG